ncbi:SPOR domain-containing protein [Oceanicola sp. 502str15]|uniref:SPOR domain-containing protein n=1 Tax=Oceanicola sp. 502str15 TaxID=2696061 RepID=UPI0020943106|nr:SPOR domain-containing protein [Oceanicola sp. 502str15]MCO6381478.1 SPOR domain-containing protein [Oceanicola sp. 502str15]
MGKGKLLHVGVVSVSVLALAACEDGAGLKFGGKKAGTEVSAAASRPAATKLVERDVEAPEVFSKNEAGLWDGRPSLGGVWIAHPDVKEPERVIIRNEANGKFVIGALFKRERDNPGPKLQVSSDAANALGLLPGAPTKLNVVALVREEVPEQAPAAVAAAPTDAATIAKPEDIEQKSLDAPLAAAEAAIAAAEGAGTAGAGAADAAVETAAATQAQPEKAKKGFWNRLKGKKSQRSKADATISAAADAAPPTAPVAVATPEISAAPLAPTAAAAPAAAPKAAGPKPSGGKNYIQIGIFSVEGNANRTAANMRKAGVVPTVYEQQSAGKTFWRVVIGPAHSAADRAALLEKVKAMGFQDAYFVSN